MPKKAFSEEQIAETRQRIMDEASRIMADQGMANFSMRQLSSALGMTAANIYNYFPNKQELFLATTLRGFELLQDTIETVNQQIGLSPREYLVALLKAAFRFAREWSGYWELMFHPPLNEQTIEGTPLETVDREIRERSAELMMAMFYRVNDLSLADRASADDGGSVAMPARAILLMTHIHGLIDLYNHRILEKLAPDGEHFVDLLIEQSVDLLMH